MFDSLGALSDSRSRPRGAAGGLLRGAAGEGTPWRRLIEMCRRPVDVWAPVSGLFGTTALIAGFTSHGENQYTLGEPHLDVILLQANIYCLEKKGE